MTVFFYHNVFIAQRQVKSKVLHAPKKFSVVLL